MAWGFQIFFYCCWAMWCFLVIQIFWKEQFFYGHDKNDQLVKIAKVCGMLWVGKEVAHLFFHPVCNCSILNKVLFDGCTVIQTSVFLYYFMRSFILLSFLLVPNVSNLSIVAIYHITTTKMYLLWIELQ